MHYRRLLGSTRATSAIDRMDGLVQIQRSGFEGISLSETTGEGAMSSVTLQAKRKLPLWHTIGQSYAIWASNFAELIQISWLWLVVMAPVIAILMWWQIPVFLDLMAAVKAGRPDPAPATTLVTNALNGLIILPMGASIAVAWHRLLLRNEHVTGSYFRFDGVVIGYGVLFFLIGLLPGLPQYLAQIYTAMTQSAGATEVSVGGGIASFIGSILTIVLWFLTGRLFMVLPAKAIGRDDITFAAAWSGTTGNTWRLFWGYFFCLIPVVVLGGILSIWLFAGEPSRTTLTVLWTLLTLAWAIIGMIGVGFLSLAFRYFFERGADGI
jgi:hypothetical protein